MAGGTGAGVNGGGRKVGEPGQADFWVLGFRIGAKQSSYPRCTKKTPIQSSRWTGQDLVFRFCFFTLFMAIMKKMDEWKVQGKRAPILSAFERGPTKMLSPVYVEGWIDCNCVYIVNR